MNNEPSSPESSNNVSELTSEFQSVYKKFVVHMIQSGVLRQFRLGNEIFRPLYMNEDDLLEILKRGRCLLLARDVPSIQGPTKYIYRIDFDPSSKMYTVATVADFGICSIERIPFNSLYITRGPKGMLTLHTITVGGYKSREDSIHSVAIRLESSPETQPVDNFKVLSPMGINELPVDLGDISANFQVVREFFTYVYFHDVLRGDEDGVLGFKNIFELNTNFLVMSDQQYAILARIRNQIEKLNMSFVEECKLAVCMGEDGLWQVGVIRESTKSFVYRFSIVH